MASSADVPQPGDLRGEFFHEIAERKRQGRDAKILLTAKDGQTGVGKTNLSVFLGYLLDTDSRFERLADYWINVERRGKAKVYKKQIHNTKRKLYYKTIQWIEWPNMDQWSAFQSLDAAKNDLLDGGHSGDWVRESEVQERIEKAEKDARQAERDRWLARLFNSTPMSGPTRHDLRVAVGARRTVALGPHRS